MSRLPNHPEPHWRLSPPPLPPPPSHLVPYFYAPAGAATFTPAGVVPRQFTNQHDQSFHGVVQPKLGKTVSFQRKVKTPPQGQKPRFADAQTTYEGVIIRKDQRPPYGELPSWSRTTLFPMLESSHSLEKKAHRRSAASARDAYHKLRSVRQRAHIDTLLEGRRRSERDSRAQWSIASIEEERTSLKGRKHSTETKALRVIFKRQLKPGSLPNTFAGDRVAPGYMVVPPNEQAKRDTYRNGHPLQRSKAMPSRVDRRIDNETMPSSGAGFGWRSPAVNGLFQGSVQADLPTLPPIILSHEGRPHEENTAPGGVAFGPVGGGGDHSASQMPRIIHPKPQRPSGVFPNVDPTLNRRGPVAFDPFPGAVTEAGPLHGLQPRASNNPLIDFTAVHETRAQQPQSKKQRGKLGPNQAKTANMLNTRAEPRTVPRSYMRPTVETVEDASDYDSLTDSFRWSHNSVELSTPASSPKSAGDSPTFGRSKGKEKAVNRTQAFIRKEEQRQTRPRSPQAHRQPLYELLTAPAEPHIDAVPFPKNFHQSTPKRSKSDDNPKRQDALTSLRTNAEAVEQFEEVYIRKLQQLCRDEAQELKEKLREIDKYEVQRIRDKEDERRRELENERERRLERDERVDWRVSRSSSADSGGRRGLGPRFVDPCPLSYGW